MLAETTIPGTYDKLHAFDSVETPIQIEQQRYYIKTQATGRDNTKSNIQSEDRL